MMGLGESADLEWWRTLALIVGYTDDDAARFAQQQVAAGLTAVDGIRMIGVVAAAERREIEDGEATAGGSAGTLDRPE